MSAEETSTSKRKTAVAVKRKSSAAETELVRKKPSSPEAELVRRKPSSPEAELVRKKTSSPEAELVRKKPSSPETELVRKKSFSSEAEQVKKKPSVPKTEPVKKASSVPEAESVIKKSSVPKKRKLRKSVKAVMATACVAVLFGGVMTFRNAHRSVAAKDQQEDALTAEETEAVSEILPEITEEPTTEEPTTEEPTTEVLEDYAPFIDYTYEIDPDKPMIALTYDDGPSDEGSTKQILDALEENHAHATFFVVGEMINEDSAELLRREVELGCEIGNHTWEHESLRTQNLDDARDALRATDEAVYEAVGRYPSMIRPPYGEYSDEIREAEDRMFIYWSLDTNDWKYLDADMDYQILMDNLSDGDIILMHDIHQASADASEQIIPDLIEMGYQLVTVSELMYYRNFEQQPGVLLFHVQPQGAYYDSLYEIETDEDEENQNNDEDDNDYNDDDDNDNDYNDDEY